MIKSLCAAPLASICWFALSGLAVVGAPLAALGVDERDEVVHVAFASGDSSTFVAEDCGAFIGATVDGSPPPSLDEARAALPVRRLSTLPVTSGVCGALAIDVESLEAPSPKSEPQ